MPPGDVLSDVLRTVRLTGALYFLVEASSPWEIAMPAGTVLAPALMPRAQQVISYHVVTRGACWGRLAGGAATRIEAGDILVFPRGDPYVMSIDPATGAGPDEAEVLDWMKKMSVGELPSVVVEGGDGPARLELVCGFLGCDVSPFNPLLGTLPRLLRVPHPTSAAGDSLRQLIELTLAESRVPRPGGECVRLRLSELMFVEVVRRHLDSVTGEPAGWLGGLRDGIVGRALGLLHERPAQPWTLRGLASEVGLSRSALAERFTHFVGHPPMQYLARWRMQLAARRLADGDAKVAAVALDVGYDSEAAFSRAFKRATGMPPAGWRRRHGPPGAPARPVRRAS
jgi:AraC-like DNA-binding protein